ncbi:ATP-binding cassette domain-containing protein [Clostridium sp. YIM B02505]|uniref:ATP-binding cassette domain-containing protein n=1 Tax=Clostridium yunnanense TaxID=2800325 RepID=A0ABS1ERM5_9CLOT|nr:ATP-binding cassette domain-containing protein [Clostridium yunnanense]MBK1811979.1 ATP-binding cassette domain-containing protein [Clostridium yunnanense]
MIRLTVSNLSHKYGNVEALKNISFEVGEGLVGVLGPNGAGKSTAMKLITTLFEIQEGNIFLNDLDYKKDLKDVRKSMGYLPQDFSAYGNLTGREFLEVVASLKLDWDKNKIKSHVDEIIEKLDMKGYVDRRFKQYSGGMKQKLGFAQVLIGNPKLIVVDEPTVGLDPEQRNVIRELFPVISKNRIVLVTTHIVEDIEFYCNYLIVIKAGNVIYKGTKEQFISEVEEIAWEADMDSNNLSKVMEKGKIIRTIHQGDKYHIKYISQEPLTDNSVKASISLQDAYIIHSSINER